MHDILTRLEGVRRIIAPEGEEHDGWQPPQSETYPERRDAGVERPRKSTAVLPHWAVPFTRPARYKSMRGGRGSSKSHCFAQISVLRLAGLLEDYDRTEPCLIASARQFQKSIDKSIKRVVEHYIKVYGLRDQFELNKFDIRHVNGSEMYFPGFTRDPDSLLSAEGIDVLWIEQAESIGNEMEKIVPTIRKRGSELWFSWNPRGRAQWCWQRFVVNPRQGDLSIHVNYNNNPWFPDELDDERMALEDEDPQRYEHVYLGMPDDGDAGSQILPYGIGQKCVEAWKAGLAPDPDDRPMMQPIDAGLDMAEGGPDKCCHVVRRGPVVEFVDLWPGVAGDLSIAAARCDEKNREHRAWRVYYDSSSPMRTEFVRLRVNYGVRPIAFGGAVGGKDEFYEQNKTNGDQFARRNIQLADAVRLRANRTVRLLKGERNIDPMHCLFIRDFPNIDAFLTGLSQATRRIGPATGKWELDKRGGDDKAESPDDFDGLCLAFSRDSDNGLKARR